MHMPETKAKEFNTYLFFVGQDMTRLAPLGQGGGRGLGGGVSIAACVLNPVWAFVPLCFYICSSSHARPNGLSEIIGLNRSAWLMVLSADSLGC